MGKATKHKRSSLRQEGKPWGEDTDVKNNSSTIYFPRNLLRFEMYSLSTSLLLVDHTQRLDEK